MAGEQPPVDVGSVIRHPSPVTHLARIELGPTEIPRFWENGVSGQVAVALKKIGYAHVTLDLQGYRRGSTNEILSAGKRSGVAI